eukprot:Awhi_evm1s36
MSATATKSDKNFKAPNYICTCCAVSCMACGNKNSKVFHISGKCDHFKKPSTKDTIAVGPNNQVCFASVADAIKQ